MTVAVMTFRLRVPWVHSLKEKRMIVKSLTAKLQNKFHVSAAEVMAMDVNTAIYFCKDMKTVYPRLKTLQDLGLG